MIRVGVHPDHGYWPFLVSSAVIFGRPVEPEWAQTSQSKGPDQSLLNGMQSQVPDY
jgi:hypothetical protein